MDTKIPDKWKDLKLEFKEPVKYKTKKILINDYDEYYKNKIKKNTPLPNRSKPVSKCIIQ